MILATLIVPVETIAIPRLPVTSRLPWLGPGGLTTGWPDACRAQIEPVIADGLTIFPVHPVLQGSAGPHRRDP